MSEMDAAYPQSPLTALSIAYSDPRLPPVQPLNTSGRPSRVSYRPGLNPPPTTTPPAPPTVTSQPSNPVQQYSQPSRLQNLAANGISHPYSAQPFASTSEWNQDLDDGFSSGSEQTQRLAYRQHPPQSKGPFSSSQAQGLNLKGRQPSSSSLKSNGEHNHQPALAGAWEGATVVSPGSYFAAYPPMAAALARDRSDSGTSDVSMGSSSHATSTSGPPSAQGPPSLPPIHTHGVTQSVSTVASSPSSQQPHSSTSHSSSHRTRPSSRKALTAALELAKSAVQLDSTSDDPHGAVLAYAKAVKLLSEVMERVMRGEEPPSATAASGGTSTLGAETEERRRGGRRRSVVAKEEEVRRLKAIHDTYADRMKILCLIYSIPDPLPSGHYATSTPVTSAQPTADRHATSNSSTPTGVAPQQVAPIPNSPAVSLPHAPEDTCADDSASGDGDTATIKKGHRPNVASQDWEVDSDWERRGLTRDRPRNRERERGHRVSTSGYSPQQLHQSPVSEDAPSGSAASNVRPLYAPGAPRTLSQDSAPPTTGSIPISLSGLRSSPLPPQRPPPCGPIPNRPRLPSGSSIPPQFLNQPLPPLPATLKSQNAPDASTHPAQTPSQQTITRQSSLSSVSVTSGASTTASGSSSASHLLGQTGTANLVQNPILGTSTSLSTAAFSTGTGTGTSANGRPRKNSNSHGRNPSNADRLGALSEEREEEENSARMAAAVAIPPAQEYKHRSRSSSMVSLKDRDRVRAQVHGANSPLPPIPPTPVVSTSSTTTLADAENFSSTPRRLPHDISASDSKLPSPTVATFGTRPTPRPRGGSVGSAATHSEDYLSSSGSPIIASVASLVPYTAGGVPPPTSAPIVIPGALGGSDPELVKINNSTNSGTISQRRQKNSLTNSTPGSTNAPLPSLPTGTTAGPKLTSAVLPASTATSLGLTGRSRATSNPGKWPPNAAHPALGEASSRPPMPPPPMSAGPRRQFPTSSSTRYQPFGIPSPGASAGASTVSLLANGAPIAGVPSSALPPAPPALSVLRPYHLMSLLRKTITDRTGGYVTPRLHVPHEVWTQGSAKLSNSAEKIKVVDVLVAALDELASASIDFCGTASGIVSSTGGENGDRKRAERWASKLEEFDRAFSSVGENFGKKLGVGGGFVVKKSVGMSAWSSKMFDKITAVGKSYDSPIAYSNLLARFFTQVQLLDEHTRALHLSPQPPSYASLPQDVRNRIENALKSISELFAKVVLTFVFRDLNVMLDKYSKTCEKWIQSNPGSQP